MLFLLLTSDRKSFRCILLINNFFNYFVFCNLNFLLGRGIFFGCFLRKTFWNSPQITSHARLQSSRHREFSKFHTIFWAVQKIHFCPFITTESFAELLRETVKVFACKSIKKKGANWITKKKPKQDMSK